MAVVHFFQRLVRRRLRSRHLEEARVESERVRPHVRRLGRLSDEGGGVARPSIDSMALDALPIFHRSTWELLAEAQRVYPRTVLLVPNWYFGNRDLAWKGLDSTSAKLNIMYILQKKACA